MMRLLPGDRLWNRYQVDSVVADAAIGGAWLTPLKGMGRESGRFLLVPIALTPETAGTKSQAAPSLLGELLRLAGSAWRNRHAGKTTGSPGSHNRKSRAPSAGASGTSNSADLPLLGRVEWIGSPSEGGLAVVPSPASVTLAEFVQKNVALAPAQVLPLLSGLAKALAALFNVLALQERESEPLRQAAIRLLTPGGLALRCNRAELILRADVPAPMQACRPVPWADFVPPELFRGQSPGANALVFSLARVASCMLVGIPPSSAPGSASAEAEWSALAAWAAGKRNPVEEFTGLERAATLPVELRDLLAACLGARTRRVASVEKLSMLLDAMHDLPWAREGVPCALCGFVRPLRSLGSGDANAECVCCGTKETDASAPESRGAGSGSARRANDSAGRSSETRLDAGSQAATDTQADAALAGMTPIAAGIFLSGEDKVPRSLRLFAIDTTPVTEGAFKRFLAEAGKTPRAGGPGSRDPDYDNHPATHVTWYEATEFAEHYGKRLPTVFEWEKAARGLDGRKFPFGNEYKSGHGLLRAADESNRKARTDGGTKAVGSFPAGASPYGVMDMAGNVLEWTSSARRAGERLFRAVKGSCFIDGSSELARCTSVQYLPPESTEPYVGFRCVKDVE